jgi:hypothetical protein
MKTLKFKRLKEVIGGDVAGFEEITKYVCGNWTIVSIGSGWVVSYNNKQIQITKTLKEAKASVCGVVAFNENMF